MDERLEALAQRVLETPDHQPYICVETALLKALVRDWFDTLPSEGQAEFIELQRRAIAVTRMWDALGRCEDEFLPEDPAACGEFQERLDMAIDGLMKLVDREMWDRRQAWMREAAEIVLREAERRQSRPLATGDEEGGT